MPKLFATAIMFVNAAAGVWPGDEEEKKPKKQRRKRKQEPSDDSQKPKSGRGI